jgi:hypothetical protein
MTLTEAEADKLPLTARMTLCPGATPVIAPSALTVATVGASLDHVTDVELLLTVAVAGSVAFVATTAGTWIEMVGDGGVGSVGAADSEPPPPPHAAIESSPSVMMKSRRVSSSRTTRRRGAPRAACVQGLSTSFGERIGPL